MEGYCNILGKEYYFSFDEKLFVISLIPHNILDLHAIEAKAFSNDLDDFPEHIFGFLAGGNRVVFSVYLKSIGTSGIQFFVLEFYEIDNRNSQIDPGKQVLYIYGDSIEKLYPPKHAIELIHKDTKIGSQPYPGFDVQVKEESDSATEFILKYGGHETQVSFRISQSYNSKDRMPLDGFKSYLMIVFPKLKLPPFELKDIRRVIERIKKVFCFLFHVKNISFEYIKFNLSIRELNGIHSGKIKLYEKPESEELKPVHFLYLKGVIGNVLDQIYSSDIDTSFFPNNQNERLSYTDYRIMSVFTAFEREFRRSFPNYSRLKKAEYKTAKDMALSVLETTNNLSGASKKYYQEIIKNVKAFDYTLADKIRYALSNIEYLKEEFKKQIGQYKAHEFAEAMSRYRNDLAHGNEVDVNLLIHPYSFVILEKLITILYLRRKGADETHIQEFVTKGILQRSL